MFNFFACVFGAFVLDAGLVLANPTNAGLSWLAMLVMLGLSGVALGSTVNKRWDGIMIDSDNRISLSRFQLICWTILLLGSLAAMGIYNLLSKTGAGTALNIQIDPQIWALLGLPAFTAITASAIKDSNRGTSTADKTNANADKTASDVKARENLTADPTFDGRVLTKPDPTQARWLDMVLGDFEGAQNIDASKFQKLVITLLVLVVYAGSIWAIFSKADGSPLTAFPPVTNGLVALLGISHAAYLADKQFSQT